MNEPPPIPGLAPDLPGPSDLSFARDPAFIDLLTDAYREKLGASLAPSTVRPSDAAEWLYEEAPFCLLAHNAAADPRFVYANRTAQTCFGYDWDEITSLLSRLSAETPDQAERQALIDAVRRAGFVTGYRGLRIAKSGRRFWIENVTMWQLTDATGAVRGQAAIYGDWRDA